jgi:hypothetical protein
MLKRSGNWMLKEDASAESIVEFATMTDGYYCDYLSRVVNLITNAPVAHTNSPLSF